MKIKIFGRDLFEVGSSKADALLASASRSAKESKFLPDFYNLSQNGGAFFSISEAVSFSEAKDAEKKKKKKTSKKTEDKKKLSPKNIYQLELLHDRTFELKTEPKYVDEQLEDFRDKLALIKSEEYDMANGVHELRSIVSRLENRKRYPEVEEFYSQFPYTTTDKIETLEKKYDHLKLGQIAQFLADMPPEATKVMKEYNKFTKQICEKQAVFYIIANKKDFQKTNKRRDPILLAQSPFGHAWQILGAWDEEMLLVDEL